MRSSSLPKGLQSSNDSYNSNPDALISMVQTLVGGGATAKRRIVVAGEMLELGPDAEPYPPADGTRAWSGLNIDMLIGVRGLGAEIVAGVQEAGFSNAVFGRRFH